MSVTRSESNNSAHKASLRSALAPIDPKSMATCPACRRSLALADRNGRHVASEVHYPHRDDSGVLACSPPARAEMRKLTVDGGVEPGSPGRAPRMDRTAASFVARKVTLY
jgi:hypothetical protein